MRRAYSGEDAHQPPGKKKSGGLSAAALVCRVTKDPARLVRDHLRWMHSERLK